MPMHCLRCQAVLEPQFRACPHCGEAITDFLRRYRDEPVDGKYRILERLGTGGMGEVYKVEHTFLGSIRVIKVIRPQISGSQDAHDRFLREARLATRVQHRSVATLYDFSALPDGSHYMVWEFIDGENLAQRIHRRGSLPPGEAVRIAADALEGLEAIHRAGIVHRDISPENLMLARGDHGVEHVKIIDLGVAKADAASGAAVTQTGIFVGKLRYASPEHLGFLPDGQQIDGRADLYSMAIVLYEMLAGRPPFEATSPHQMMMMHSRDTVFEPLALPKEMPGGSALQAVVTRALQRDRDRRFSSAAEFADALQDVATTLATFDGDATMRVTPPPDRAGATTTITTAPVTLIATKPSIPLADSRPTVAVWQKPVTPAEREPSSVNDTRMTSDRERSTPQKPAARWLVPAVMLALFAIAGIALLLLLGRSSDVSPALSGLAAPATSVTRAVSSSSTVDVVNATAPPAVAPGTVAATASSATSGTVASPQVSPPAPADAGVRRAAPEPAPSRTTSSAASAPPAVEAASPVVRREEPPAAGGATFHEGGDSDANERAVEDLRHAIAGVTRVGVVVTGEFAEELPKVLHKRVPGVDFVNGNAAVTIHFEGAVERLGRFRKRRSARATVSRDGRVVFRYELAPEEYRAGDNPAEAFARAVSDGFH